ncbi:XrtA/PEP-CTERM system histidine kinase PrsK [Sphingomonas rubra]|nr:XrtA/PEP-CTERM system histidine kinase PrsK [Sphingomonas rubra]
MLNLWTHALVALLFGAMALAGLRGGGRDWPRWSFITAALLTALWALAVAGIDAHDIATRLAKTARDIAWLCFAAMLIRRERAGNRAIAMLYAVTIGVVAATAVVSLAMTGPLAPATMAAADAVRQMLIALASLAALMLLCHLAQNVRHDGRWMALALVGSWSIDLIVATVALIAGEWPAWLGVVRGGVMLAVGSGIAVAAQRRGAGGPTLSRTAAIRLIGVAVGGCYLALTALAADRAGGLDPAYARPVQIAIVLGATVALLTLASTPWLRAWMRVKLAKHLFAHRYDYRVEWQRFAATLGRPTDGEPLPRRLVKALADLTDSPAGLLLCRDDDQLVPLAHWAWPGTGEPVADPALAGRLAGGHIVALDEERRAGTLPSWLRVAHDAWVMVPLIHGDLLTGAIVLARPPIDRQLDWEDLDLLRVAGRQAASYLAENRAQAALADAARFEEFNRRFAFLLHDIKNVASQLTLVARNAERHADNPAFRVDMIETLRDGAGRMTALLGRLGQLDMGRAESVQPVDVTALVHRLAAARRATGPIVVEATAALALAAPGRLEQAIGHLVQNAAEAGGVLPVRVVVGQGEKVTIDVIDEGVGMSAEFVRDKLFRPFASTKPIGFGIGAYEARQLIRAMNGTLDVDSREGAGTRFRIVLPLAPALEAAA